MTHQRPSFGALQAELLARSHRIAAPTAKPGQIAPVFLAEPPREITEPITITVTSPQIQYSQIVFLNFAGLTWPHVSVATLTPTTELTVPISAW
jgi:hypothetical protein